MTTKDEYLQQMFDCIVDMEDEKIHDICTAFLDDGFDPQEGIMDGLVKGMLKASDLYEQGEYFLPEMLVCSDAMYVGIETLRSQMTASDENSIGKVAICVVEGDTHDIGKNLVKIMLETAGFDITDLGRDVAVADIVSYVVNNDIDILVMSSLMTTTMDGMRKVVDGLVENGVRNKVKIMVGGAPISSGFAKEIGADGYSADAVAAVDLAKSYVGAI